jgi:drug/metabolite transporter (DMT)-like permease
MKPINKESFERNRAEADAKSRAYAIPMIRSQMNRSDWTILLVLALIWGGAFFFIHVAVHQVAPLTYVWLRLTIAASALWVYVLWKGDAVGLPRSAWGAIFVLALLNNVIPFLLFGWGQTKIASGLASILNATTPIWGVVVAHLLTHDERMSARKLVGVVLGFGGVALMIGPSILQTLGGNTLAMLACITAALCYAIAGVWARRFRNIGLPPVAVANGQLTAGALVMLPVAMLVDRPWLGPLPTLGGWAAISALAIVCTAFAYILYFRLIETSGATNALLVTLLVPPVAILLGALFLDESLAAQDFLGLGLIALGLAAIDGRLLSALSARRLRTAS